MCNYYTQLKTIFQILSTFNNPSVSHSDFKISNKYVRINLRKKVEH